MTRLLALYKVRALDVLDLDFCKDFDMSSRSTLTGKLTRYGWNRWIRSLMGNCLEPWVEKVVIKATKSMWKLVTRGISQFASGPNWGEWSILWSAELLFRGISTGWRSRLTRISRSSTKGNEKSYAWEGITPYYYTGWGIEQLCRKGLGHPGGPQVKGKSAVYPCGDVFSSCVLGCISKNVTSRLEAIILLYPMLVRLYLEHCVQSEALQKKKDMDVLGWIRQRGTKMVKGLQHMKCEKRLREPVLFSPRKRRLMGNLVAVFKYVLIKDIVEDGSRLILEGHSDKMRGNKCNL